ncbi:unnamed protein product [Amoebophrya sp. A25]|nr:unnamed protein product [Amoebophrya sp. A25]|eukprot:GSA25T00005213001.1
MGFNLLGEFIPIGGRTAKGQQLYKEARRLYDGQGMDTKTNMRKIQSVNQILAKEDKGDAFNFGATDFLNANSWSNGHWKYFGEAHSAPFTAIDLYQ